MIIIIFTVVKHKTKFTKKRTQAEFPTCVIFRLICFHYENLVKKAG